MLTRNGYRLVFFQPLLLLFLVYLSRTFAPIDKKLPHSILQTFTIYSLIPLGPCPSDSPRQQIRLNFLHHNMQSWSTHFGS